MQTRNSGKSPPPTTAVPSAPPRRNSNTAFCPSSLRTNLCVICLLCGESFCHKRPLGLPIHHPTLHHKIHLLHSRHTPQRTPRHPHDIRQLPRLNRPQQILHPQQLRRRGRRRADRLRRSHPKLHHRRKFLRRIDL